MSAAYWRRAMNSGAAGVQVQPPAQTAIARGPWAARHPGQRSFVSRWLGAIRIRHVIVLAAVLVYPWVASPFFTFQIGGQALALGLIALSLTFLAGYGGMVSLAQMTIAGMAGYVTAIFGTSVQAQISLGWPWWLVLAIAVVVPTINAAFIGWLSVRTAGIYTIMITLVGSRFKGGDLVGIYAVSGLFWGLGALVGPLGAGFAMQVHPHGLAVFATLACALFAAAAWRLRGSA